jgi:hypothetical protein
VKVRHTTVLTGFGILALLWIHPTAARLPSDRNDEEIVAGLAGGRVIVFVARDKIVFAAVDQPIEKGAAPPRVVDLGGRHVGVLLGASEWRMPADPKPVRLDRDVPRFGPQDPRYAVYAGDAEPDLETIGEAFLEKLHPLAARLHHQLSFPPDQALLELVIIGYGPQDYGPEVWTVEYRMTQEEISSNLADYWQTRVLRPRFTQLYPPEKHAPRTLVEARYPGDAKGPAMQDLVAGNDPRIAQLCSSDPRLAKVCELLDKGESQKADPNDAADLLRAALPLVFPNKHFIMATIEEQHGFDWIVPPEEPVEKAGNNKNQPPEAPTLRRRPDSP